MAHLLDFEKPIAELEAKLQDLKSLAATSNVDVSTATVSLEEQIHQLKKETYHNLSRWQRVQMSRHPDRPYALDYIQTICENFQELHGDRNVGDDQAMIGGLGQVEDQTVFFVGQQKGRTTKERQMRRFGMPNPEGYRKALRIMKMGEKFGKPIVTLIDTPGAYPGLEAEERGQGEAIARNLREMFMLKVPIVCIIIGEGASGGALGIGIGDRVIMLENTWYSVISPESCSSILWRSWNFKEQAAEALKLTAKDMKGNGLVDEVVKEPLGGAHTDPAAMARKIKKVILDAVAELTALPISELIDRRIEKFSEMGVVVEPAHT